jgi:hypothetical protein
LNKVKKIKMAKNQREVEDALFQIKNLEESLQRNAQGILSSTMREEINSLVKESLKEQDEVEDEEEVEVDIEDTDTDNEEFTDDDEYAIDNMGDEEMMGQEVMPSDDDTVDLTQASDSEVLRVFRAMGDNDGVIVKRDDNMIHLSDNENNAEYIIQLSESMDEMDMGDMPRIMSRKSREMEEMDMGNMSSYEDEEDDEEDDFENLSFGSEEDEDEDEFGDYMPMNKLDMGIREKGMLNQDPMGGKFQSNRFDDEEGFDDEFDYMSLGEEEDKITMDNGEEFSRPVEENIYELELDDEDGMFGGSKKRRFEFDEEDFSNEEKYHSMMEAKGFKAKGVGMGNASKYRMSKKPNMDGGFKTVKKTANKTMGTGRPKFEYKEGENLKGDFNVKPPKMETKEASRTYGNGSKSGRGLRKGITPNRNLTLENKRELELLRGKNDEYRKALDLFRTKLNEVAVFNSNLAYATRLFTEHSTTKQEKINILRRFDNAETLKESKNLYRTLKSELDSPKASENTITESVQRRVEITPSTGSAANLIESKTYENPQFLRMKDLMTKIK